MKFTNFKNQKGFSLVELMIVVGIIGILATLALPRFKQFQAKAKMGEAKNILSHLYTLEQTYALDNNSYLNVEEIGASLSSLKKNNCTPGTNAELIGFRVDPCQDEAPIPRYRYSAFGNAGDFNAKAVTGNTDSNRVCPGNNQHFFAINEDNVIWGATGTGPADATSAAGTSEPSVGAVCAK